MHYLLEGNQMNYTKYFLYLLIVIETACCMEPEQYEMQLLINVDQGPISTALLRNYKFLKEEGRFALPLLADELEKAKITDATLLEPQVLLDYCDFYYKRVTTPVNDDDIYILQTLQKQTPRQYYAFCAGIFNSMRYRINDYSWQKELVLDKVNEAEPFLRWFHQYVERDRYVHKEKSDLYATRAKVITFLASIELIALAAITLTLYVHPGC